MNYGHVLIFGGTGMLAKATGWIAARSERTVVFGRNRHRLERIAKQYDGYGLEVKQLDYTDNAALIREIHAAHSQHGPIGMVVAWIHGTAPKALPTIKEQISRLQSDPWTLVHIKGSSSRLSDITKPDPDAPENCQVKEVRLGFVYDGTSSRWLTHEEISDGIIEAIKGNQPITVVGTLEPWDKRP